MMMDTHRQQQQKQDYVDENVMTASITSTSSGRNVRSNVRSSSSSSSRITMSSNTTSSTVVDTTHKRIHDILSKMTLKDKIGQMSQIEINMLLNDDKSALNQDLLDHYIGELGVGSVLNNIVPPDNQAEKQFWTTKQFRQASIQIQETASKYNRVPVIWGLDSVHGANYLIGKIITPQPINIAASFNTTISKIAGQYASYNTRQAGINWLFSPLLGITWNSYWSRLYETFGEDPFLTGKMAANMIYGIQQSDYYKDKDVIVPSIAAACGKHFIGYSIPHNGHDRVPSWIPKRHLYQYFVLPWKYVLLQQSQTQSQQDDTTVSVPKTIMESYTEIDGIPNVENRYTLDYLLRQRLKYHDGVLVTDYNEIYNLAEFHHTTQNKSTAIIQSIQEGTVDMSMIPWDVDTYYNTISNHVNVNVDSSHNNDQESKKHVIISEERINRSVERVLKLKFDLNMFDETITMENGGILDNYDDNNNDDDDDDDNNNNVSAKKPKPTQIALADALDMTHQSIILVKNSDHTLPITKNKNNNKKLKVLVTGPTSSSLSYQTGGWSGLWQGIVEPSNEKDWFTYGTTILDAAKQESNNWDVTYECGVSITGGNCNGDNDVEEEEDTNTVIDKMKSWVGWDGDNDDIDIPSAYYSIERAMSKSAEKDIIIICVGEESNTEKPGDIRSLRLPQGQYQLVEGLKQTSSPTTKIVLLYFGGRPRLLETMVDNVDAVLLGFLPGPHAGQASMDIITGRVNPSAKLPITYPKYEDLGGVPYLHSVSDMCTKGEPTEPLPHYENVPCEVQWPFGHGLSYTTFEYSDLTLSDTILKSHRAKEDGKYSRVEDDLTVSVRVQNSGPTAGAETVLFFTFDEFRDTTPEYKRLRSFEKVWLEPGQSTQVQVTIPLDDLRFVGPHDDSHYILQDGLEFQVGVGANTDCRQKTGDSSACSQVITIRTEEDYVGACEAACNIWSSSGCSDYHHMALDTCWEMCTSIHGDVDLQMNNDGWGWNYVSCLEDIVWGNDFHKDPSQCWKMTSFCRNVFVTDHMDEFGRGAVSPTADMRVSDVVSIGLGSLVGLLVSLAMYWGVRGGFSQKQDEPYGNIEFTEVPGKEPAAPETELTI